MGEMGDSGQQGEPTPLVERSHVLHVFIGRAHERLDELESVLTATMTTGERGETVAEATRFRDRLDALITTLVAEDPVAVTELRNRTNVSAQTARRITKRAITWAEHPEVHQAVAAGQLHTDQADVITAVVDKLPEEVSHLAAEARRVMLDLAAVNDAPTLKQLGGHLLEVIAPQLADELLARELDREERQAQRTAYLKTYKDGHGSTYGKFKIPDRFAHLLETMLAAIANPQRPEPIDRTDKDFPEIKGQALCELIERIKTKDLSKTGGTAVSVIVTMTLDTLEGGLKPAGILGTDLQLSPGEARRWAAVHGVIPVVLGAKSEILDVGRRKRLYTRAQRVAMALRQGGLCNVEGCDIPTAWCDANHRNEWALGGATDLADGELICRRHHTATHQGVSYPRRT